MENPIEIRQTLNGIVKELRKIKDQLNNNENALLLRIPKEIRDTHLRRNNFTKANEGIDILRKILNKYTLDNQIEQEQEDLNANFIVQDEAVHEDDVLNSTPIRFIGDRAEDLYAYIIRNNNVTPVSSSSKSRKKIKNIHDLRQILSLESISIITQIPGDETYPYQATVQSFMLSNGNLIETASAQVRKTQDQLENMSNKDLIAMGRYISRKGKNIAKPITRASELRMIKNLNLERLINR